MPIDLAAWIQPVQVRDVAVLIFGIIPIHQPFLKLAMPTDFHGRQTRSCFRHLRPKGFVDVQNL